MQVTQIECKIGVTLNMGDFKSMRADFGMVADLDRNEDEAAAAAQLRAKVMANLVAMGSDAHPDRMRGLVEGNQIGKGAIEGPKEMAKRGPKPKTNGATVAQTTSATVASPGEAQLLPSEPTLEDELSDSIPANGGGSANLLDEGDDLLNDAEPEITKEVLTAKCRELIAKSGNPALLKIFKTVGADSMKTVTVDKYQTLYAKVMAALAA